MQTDIDTLVDTGCSSLRLPSHIVQSYYAKVPGLFKEHGLHIFPVGVTLPDRFLYIGEERYEVRISGKLLIPQGGSEYDGVRGEERCKFKNPQPSNAIATNLLYFSPQGYA